MPEIQIRSQKAAWDGQTSACNMLDRLNAMQKVKGTILTFSCS